MRGHYTEVLDYGFPVAWLVLPLGAGVMLVLWVLATFTFLMRVIKVVRKRPAPDLPPETWTAVLLALTAFVMLYMTPALWASRYNLAPVAMMATLAWAGSRAKWERFGEGRASAVALGDMHMGSPTTLEVGTKREKILAPGSVLVHDELYGNFVALLWNNDYSNRLVFVPRSVDFIKRAEDAGAFWIYAQLGDPIYTALSKKGSGWVEVGSLNVEHWGSVFRRESW